MMIQEIQKPPRVVLRKWCSENMQQVYRKTLMSKCNFNHLQSSFIEIAFHDGCSPVNVLQIFKTTFFKRTSGRLLLKILIQHLGITSPLKKLFVVILIMLLTFTLVFIRWFERKILFFLSKYYFSKKKMNESGNFIAIKQSSKIFLKKRRIHYGNFKIFSAVDFNKRLM